MPNPREYVECIYIAPPIEYLIAQIIWTIDISTSGNLWHDYEKAHTDVAATSLIQARA